MKKENIVKNIGIVRVENVQTAFNTLSAMSVLSHIKDHAPNAIQGPSQAIIFVKFNQDGTIKKGFRKIVAEFKKVEMKFAEDFGIPKKFSYVRANIVD